MYVNSNALPLPLYCFRCSVTCSSTVKNVYVNSNDLFLPLYCFRCSVTCNSTAKNVDVLSNTLLLPLYCFRCSITSVPLWRICMCTLILCSSHSIVFDVQLLQFHYEEYACALKYSAAPTLLFSMFNYFSSTMKNTHVHSNTLLLPLYCFRCSITSVPLWRICMCTQILCSFHSIVTGAQLLCSCVLLFVLLTSVVLAVVCHRKNLLHGWRIFAWQPNVPTDCRTVPTDVILHPIGVSLRPFVSLVTYVLRTRTANTVIICQPKHGQPTLLSAASLTFSHWVHPVVPVTDTKTKESGYSFHTTYICFKKSCRLAGEPG